MEGQSAATGDVQSPKAPVSENYGDQAKQLAAQHVVPIPKSPGPSPSTSAGLTSPNQISLEPGSGVPLSAETIYPEELLTTGLPNSPGAGPEVLRLSSAGPPHLAELRAINEKAGPSEPLRQLIEWAEQNP